MPAYTSAIADIGETLITLLREGLSGLLTPESIILYSPGELGSGERPRLCLFLYQVAENPQRRNRPPERITDETLKQPGMLLDLYYMLVPYESSTLQDLTDRTKEDHAVLGKAMQIFFDNGILRDPALKGGLAGRELRINLTLNPVPLDEMTKIWHSFQTKPFKASICYLVSPVEIETGRVKQVKPVTEARIDSYVKPERAVSF